MTDRGTTVQLVIDTGAPELTPVFFVYFPEYTAPVLRHAATLIGERTATIQLNGMDALEARYTVQAWIASLEANSDVLVANYADDYNYLLGDLFFLRGKLAIHTKTRIRAYQAF